jgi:hypothetical protein
MACPAATTYVRTFRALLRPRFAIRQSNQQAESAESIKFRLQCAFLRARFGAGRGPCLWRSEASPGVLVGSASLVPSSSPRAARDTRARASELQQAPWPAGAPVASHKVTVHDRQRGVVHEFVVPEVPRKYTCCFAALSVPVAFPFLVGKGLCLIRASTVRDAGPVHSAHRGGAGHPAAVRVPPWYAASFRPELTASIVPEFYLSLAANP